MRKLANHDIYHIRSYPSEHRENSTVLEFEGKCDHGDAMFARVDFPDYVLEDIRTTGDMGMIVRQAMKERCRKDHAYV